MNLPDDRKYNRSHEWALEDAELVTVGITDYAQDQLGDVVYVELPERGRKVAANEAIAVVESVKTASDIYAPIAGEVIEVNGELESHPEAINEDPYGSGWLLRIRPEGDAGAGLLDADGYRRVVEEDS